MTIKIGINGFGRMGRLTLRALMGSAGFHSDNFVVTQINDPAGDAKTFAHLLNFDSVHGRWIYDASYIESNEKQSIVIDGHEISFTQNKLINETNWSDCDIVIEASGQFKTKTSLSEYLDLGVKRVVVTAPVKEEGVLNIVMGVNQHLYNHSQHSIVTAASCTTNCLAPVVKVLHEKIGIRHGSMTTIHDITNTQVILDSPHADLRRSRACGMSLIPTTTGSATAITHIFPELKGKLNGHAVRVPLANASLTDCVFELNREVTIEEINQLFKTASESELKGVLGYEERPLVSIDYRTDPRSSIVDALSTMVVNASQLKVYIWYDNEWGYVNRTAELVNMIIAQGV
ncbi:MAG: ArsJ-associated glyceraldehyde-3-phosphate dehydrogenase [Kangiellaceae bacterium]